MTIKIRICFPKNNTCKMYLVYQRDRLESIAGKRVGQTFRGEDIGTKYILTDAYSGRSPNIEGYVFRITGGQDRLGFPIRKGLVTERRVRFLLSPGEAGYQKWRAKNKFVKRKKMIRGDIVTFKHYWYHPVWGPNFVPCPCLTVLECIIVKKGKYEIDGLTNKSIPNKRGPIRANNIRKLYDLEKDIDLTKFLPIEKKKELKNGYYRIKKPRIQRLLTSRKKRRRKINNSRKTERKIRSKIRKEEYKQLLNKMREK